jgi:hypothetical protein
MSAASEAVGETVVEGVGWGADLLVKLTLHTIRVISIRPSVQTRMAVGLVAIFQSVRIVFPDVSKIASCAHFIGIRTD